MFNKKFSICRSDSDKNRQRDRGIEMATRDVPAGVNHHHEGSADRERRDDAGRARDNRAANGEHEKESADKFCNVFFHLWSTGLDEYELPPALTDAHRISARMGRDKQD